MSIDHVSRVLNLPPTVTGTNRMVLLVLAEAANKDTDECWPKLATIGSRAGITQPKYVRKAVSALAEMGYIGVDLNGCPDHRIPGNRRPSLYRMTGPMALLSVEDHGGARRAPPEGDDLEPGGARRAGQGGRDAPIAPYIEPELEPSVTSTASTSPVGEPAGPQMPPPSDFTDFWDRYPRRNGKRLGKPRALAKWKRMSRPQRLAALAAVDNYADSPQIPMDAHRWLSGQSWSEWQTPAIPDQPKQNEPQRGYR